VQRKTVDQRVLATHRGRSQPLVAQRSSLFVNIDTAARPLAARLPAGYHTYRSHDRGATERRFASALASDGSIEIEVVSPFFRNSNRSGYGAVTSLHPSGDPLAGYNAVVNSGALVNQQDSGPLLVRIQDLKAGDYRIRFWLHGVFVGQVDGVEQGRWDISGTARAADVPATFGYHAPAGDGQGIPPPDLQRVGQIELPFTVARDGETATFRFSPRTLAGNLQLWVNGFELTSVTARDAQPPAAGPRPTPANGAPALAP
jgi:hypothetical protein